MWSLLPEWSKGCNHTNCFRCVLFRVLYTIFHSNSLRIWLAVTMERVKIVTFNPRVENRSFNTLYRYRKSDFQRRCYEKLLFSLNWLYFLYLKSNKRFRWDGKLNYYCNQIFWINFVHLPTKTSIKVIEFSLTSHICESMTI